MTLFENKFEAYRAYIFEKRKMRTFADVIELVAERHTTARDIAERDIAERDIAE